MSKNNNMPHKPVWPTNSEGESSVTRFESPREETTHAREDVAAPKGGGSTTLVIISLIIGFGIGWFSAGGDTNMSTPAMDDDTATTTNEIVAGENTEVVTDTEGTTDATDDTVDPNEFGVRLEVPAGTTVRVSDQFAGDSVLVDSLELKRSGWVTVYEDRGDGQPGNILGARRFEKGVYTQALVILQRQTNANQTYFIRIHADDGDDDFEFKTEDVPLVDTSGQAFTVSFKTTSVESPRGN